MAAAADLGDEQAAIAHTTARLLAAVNASDLAGVLSCWADDGVLMPPHHPAVQGRQAIEAHFRDRFARVRFEFRFTSSIIEVAGNLALERVTYTVTVRPGSGAPPLEDRGKGLHVYQRRPDGSWKLVLDIWNSDEAATPP